MKKILGLCVLIFFFGHPVQARVEVTGFVDVFYQDQQGANATFGMGAFEVHFNSEFSQKLSFEGVVVVEGNTVGLGPTLSNFKLLTEEKLALQVGLIDVPFGIDIQIIDTPDRKLVSPPLVTELIMNGAWGDVGVNLYGSLSHVNYNLFVVNGMGEDNGAPVNQLTDNNNAKTIGGRLGVLLIEDLEIGFSYVQGPYLNNNTKDLLSRIGSDIQFTYEPVKVKWEYMAGKEETPSANANENSGYYIQLLGNATEKLYGVLRYGELRPRDGNNVARMTIGIGYDLIENISLRVEHQINYEKPKQDNDQLSFQVVISF